VIATGAVSLRPGRGRYVIRVNPLGAQDVSINRGPSPAERAGCAAGLAMGAIDRHVFSRGDASETPWGSPTRLVVVKNAG
jgi:hypothetical protein